MNLSSIVLDRDNSLISEAFLHVSEHANSEIIITDEDLNIIFQNFKFNFKNQKFSLSALSSSYTNRNLNYHFSKFKNSDKNHIFFKLIFNDENNNLTNIPLNIHICKIKNNIGKLIGFTIIIQDMTQELKNNMQKQTMIDVLTHDLKNPLRANIQVLELILEGKIGEINNEVKDILQEMLSSSYYLKYMTENLVSLLTKSHKKHTMPAIKIR